MIDFGVLELSVSFKIYCHQIDFAYPVSKLSLLFHSKIAKSAFKSNLSFHL